MVVCLEWVLVEVGGDLSHYLEAFAVLFYCIALAFGLGIGWLEKQ